MSAPLRLWAKRYLPTIGWHWSYCRDVTQANYEQWLAVWQADEPETTFSVHTSRRSAPHPIKP